MLAVDSSGGQAAHAFEHFKNATPNDRSRAFVRFAQVDITALAGGGFVVAHAFSHDTGLRAAGTSTGIEVFNTDGSRRSRSIILTNATSPKNTGLTTGRFVVMWMHGSARGPATPQLIAKSTASSASSNLSCTSIAAASRRRSGCEVPA